MYTYPLILGHMMSWYITCSISKPTNDDDETIFRHKQKPNTKNWNQKHKNLRIIKKGFVIKNDHDTTNIVCENEFSQNYASCVLYQMSWIRLFLCIKVHICALCFSLLWAVIVVVHDECAYNQFGFSALSCFSASIFVVCTFCCYYYYYS